MKSRLSLVAVAVVTVALVGAPNAEAVKRPVNGQISFGKFDPALGDTSLWVANSDGTAQRRLVNVISNFSDWAPDGRRIAFDFVDDLGVHLATISPGGRSMQQITFGAGIQEVPRWSPDGNWITFDASSVFPDDPAFSTDIWLMHPDGSGARQLTQDGFDVEPVFSPDGTKVAFGRITGFTSDGSQLEALDVVNIDGSGLHEIVPPRAGLEHPDWSPDGRLVSFNISPEDQNAPGSGSMLAVRSNGSGLKVIRPATERFRFFKPVWSPDGRKILLGCNDQSTQVDMICSVKANGNGLTVVIDVSPNHVNYPAWGPLAEGD